MIIVPVKEGESIDRALKRYKRKYEKCRNSVRLNKICNSPA